MVVGERIRQARQLNGLTLQELAAALGVSAPAVSGYERGQKRPGPDVLDRLVLLTGFPKSFFEKPVAHEFGQGTLTFRCRADVPAKTKHRLQRWAEMAFEAMEHLREGVKAPALTLPRIDPEDASDPARVGELVRSGLHLHPLRPIPHLIRAAEQAGVTVLSLPAENSGVDAFSTWVGPERDHPVLFVFPTGDWARLRMTIAHELVHLACRHSQSQQAEREAAAGGSAILMPPAVAVDELVPPLHVDELLRLRDRWGVSAKAMIVAARRYGIVTEKQARRLFIQHSERGWSRGEPCTRAVERPRAFRQLAEMRYGNPPTVQRFATNLAVNPLVLGQMLDVHAEKRPEPEFDGSVTPLRPRALKRS